MLRVLLQNYRQSGDYYDAIAKQKMEISPVLDSREKISTFCTVSQLSRD